jgi:hypothetical protein
MAKWTVRRATLASLRKLLWYSNHGDIKTAAAIQKRILIAHSHIKISLDGAHMRERMEFLI